VEIQREREREREIKGTRGFVAGYLECLGLKGFLYSDCEKAFLFDVLISTTSKGKSHLLCLLSLCSSSLRDVRLRLYLSHVDVS